MSKKTDKAYESILKAFESPNDQFDNFGDDDKADIDQNFEKPNPKPEGKDWADWQKEKEPDTASEDYWDDAGGDLPSDAQLMKMIEEEKAWQESKDKEEIEESFKQEDLENINDIFSDNKDYEAVLDINADRDGESGGDRADDVSGTTDDKDNQEVKVGQNQEPNAELGSYRVQLEKDTGKDFPDTVTESQAKEGRFKVVDLKHRGDPSYELEFDNYEDAVDYAQGRQVYDMEDESDFGISQRKKFENGESQAKEQADLYGSSILAETPDLYSHEPEEISPIDENATEDVATSLDAEDETAGVLNDDQFVEKRTEDLEDQATERLKKNENLEHNDLEDLATEEEEEDDDELDEYGLYKKAWDVPVRAEDIPKEGESKASERSIAQAVREAGTTMERAKQVAERQGMDLQAVVDAGNLEDMIYDQDQEEDWSEREQNFYGETENQKKTKK